MTAVVRKERVPEQVWREKVEAHRRRVGDLVNEHLGRRSRREKHPVKDFLFEYYSFRPAHLLRWSPGFGVELEGGEEFASWAEFGATGGGVAMDAGRFPVHRVEALWQIHEVMLATQQRTAFHGCFGLHEWAMVYKSESVRHGQVRLRLPDDEVKAVVETQTVRCSHYDAFRFFTPAASPLNVLQPRADDRARMEQPGCIHANMDVYKWAYKFYPWIGSDIIGEAFLVAAFAREIDMRASPYDLREYGYEPIRLETEVGRREYQEAQREVARRAGPVRARLVEAYGELLAAVG